MKMKAKVSAQAFCPKTGTPIADQRDEIVDLEKNPLFRECASLLDVKKAYESFWNDLPANPREMVIVHQVTWA